MKPFLVRLSIPLAAILLLAACGPSPDTITTMTASAWTPTPQPTSTPTPTATPTLTPTPALPSILAAMAPVAEGQGVAEAAIYNPDEPGPHRLVLLETSGSPHAWNDRRLTDWLPSSVSETELVVLIGPEREVALGSARYKWGHEICEITRYRFEMDVEVRKARTGRTMWTDTLAGSDPGFPETVSSCQTHIVGDHVIYTDLAERLCRKSGWRLCDCRTLKGNKDGVKSVAFSPDGQTLASGAADNTVRLWRVSDLTLLRTMRANVPWLPDVNSVAFSPDGQTLASGTSSFLDLWRWDGALVREDWGQGVDSLAFSPDGQILASGSGDTVQLLQISDGTLLRTLEGHTASVYSVAFSPDGQILASGSSDKTVSLWRVSDGALLRTLEGHMGGVSSVAFSPDGQTLASGSGDNTVRLWWVSDGALLRTLEGHTGGVTSVAFSTDGKTLASGAYDTTVSLWRVPDGALLRTLEGHTDGVTSVAFSPDGQTLASGSLDYTVVLWLIR